MEQVLADCWQKMVCCINSEQSNPSTPYDDFHTAWNTESAELIIIFYIQKGERDKNVHLHLSKYVDLFEE